jgi:hypothetical protein
VNDRGIKHRIGLFHGNKTGHLLVYCNKRIILIDFHVLKSKKYSFFIDDELCNVNVERKADRFYYGLEIDNDTATPKNLVRKRIRKRNRVYIAFSFLLISLLITVITILLLWGNN